MIARFLRAELSGENPCVKERLRDTRHMRGRCASISFSRDAKMFGIM
jgi:hypothetical protein